jgi:GxxExxY protein
MQELNALSNRVIGLAIEVHRTVGPGLLETVYQECLCMELADAGIPFQYQTMIPVLYKGRSIPLGFRADIVVAEAMILEIKAVDALIPTHEAQILTYLRMSGIRLGFLMSPP